MEHVSTSPGMENQNKFGHVSPVECYKLRILAMYLTVLFILSVSFNSILLFVFWRNKQFHSPHNVFMITLTVFNLLGSLIEFPFVIFSNIYCRFVFFSNF